MRAVVLGFAGLWAVAVVGCGNGTVCLTAADCGDGMSCSSTGTCTARRGQGGAGGTARNTNGSTGSNGARGANGNGNTGQRGVITGLQGGMEGAQAWLGGQLGAQPVDADASVQVCGVAEGEPPGTASALILHALDLQSGMLIVYLPQPLQDLPQSTPVALGGAQVCGAGDGSGTWSYDTYSTNGTVTVTPDGNGGVDLALEVLHGDGAPQQARARAHIPQL